MIDLTKAMKDDAARLLLLTVSALALGLAKAALVQLTGIEFLGAVLDMLTVLLVLVIAVHVIRRLMFHRMDIQTIAIDAARLSPHAGGMVFVGVCIVVSTLIWAAVTLLS